MEGGASAILYTIQITWGTVRFNQQQIHLVAIVIEEQSFLSVQLQQVAS